MSEQHVILVTTYPFGSPNDTPLRQLEGQNVYFNGTGREYTRDELVARLEEDNPTIIIAGTEKYTPEVLKHAPRLRMISRVGVGLDSVDLDECKRLGITVCYTPLAPSNAVAELTVAEMIFALRRVRNVDEDLRNGTWNRHIGLEIRSCDVGIIGFGRIGRLVAQKLSGLKPRRIFVNDIDPSKCQNAERCELESKLQIICNCDVITLHIPYSKANHHFIDFPEFRLMKPTAVLINTSRGGVVNETALRDWLQDNPTAYACVDVYASEPYTGALLGERNTILTPHLGSCSTKSRFDMEVGATEEALNFINGKPFNNKVC